ncbi:plasmid mobilization relaxosome protein MobC, partial [Rhizobium redzepovicii]|uniref:plasmid mobilization relaxosome protein MobC n=1 Tax=Rhizobium redzepovicii TaxID=2867518 RepID=UPI001C92D84F
HNKHPNKKPPMKPEAVVTPSQMGVPFGRRSPQMRGPYSMPNHTLGELGRIGGNLNQLVRRANGGRLAGHDAELSETLLGIDALRDRIRDLLA